RFEISTQRELIIMSPTGMNTGRRNSKLNYRLAVWAERDGTGECCDSSSMFTLPNGAKRSPDGAWILKSRLKQFTEEEKDGFTKICPDFVVELRLKSDRLAKLKQKMEEFIANGAQLGWLLDPLDNCAYIYRPGGSPERIDKPDVIK